MNWFEKLFSSDELRVSALVVSLLIMIISILVYYFITGQVSQELVGLTEALIIGVGGVSISSIIKGNKNTYTAPLEQPYISPTDVTIIKDSDVPEEKEQRI
jgi:hypothetical protein